MQIAANQKLVRNRVRLGTGFNIASLAVLGLGVVVSLQQPLAVQYWWLSPALLLVGMLLFLVSQAQLRRWGPNYRQTDNLERAIRGLDDRYKLYGFLATDLPDYILSGPAGVTVLTTRSERAPVSCIRDAWKRQTSPLRQFFDSPFGNPSRESQRDTQKVRGMLAAAGMEDVPVQGLIVFTDPAVKLRVEGCSVPVARLKDLRDTLRRGVVRGQSAPLSGARVRQIQAYFDERLRVARTWR